MEHINKNALTKNKPKYNEKKLLFKWSFKIKTNFQNPCAATPSEAYADKNKYAAFHICQASKSEKCYGISDMKSERPQ